MIKDDRMINESLSTEQWLYNYLSYEYTYYQVYSETDSGIEDKIDKLIKIISYIALLTKLRNLQNFILTVKQLKISLDLACRQVLMSAYLYYQKDEIILTDHENDRLCEYVVDNWADVPERYKPLLDPANIPAAGDYEGSYTAFASGSSHCIITEQVKYGALAWLESVEKRNKR